MHKTIKRFSLTGEISDNKIIQSREHIEKMILENMRDHGYVPVLDLGPYWSTVWHKERDVYDFELSVYGVHVGRRKASSIEGFWDGKEIPRHIPQNKSNPSSEASD